VDYDIIGQQLYNGGYSDIFAQWGLGDPSGIPTWDLAHISALLDRLGEYGRPVHITEQSVPSTWDPDWTQYGAGWWHHPWNEETQAEFLRDFYTIAFSKEPVEAITWWDINDNSFIFTGGLLDSESNPKPAYAATVSDSATVRAFFVDHLLAGRVDPPLRERAADPVDAEPRVLSSGGEARGEGSWGFVSTFVIPYFLSFFLIMTIFVSSGYLLQGVGEEKESRVIEIVVSSVRPVELMAGKMLGLGALGLTQVLVWLLSTWGFSGGAVVFLSATGMVSLPLHVLGLGVVYYLLGFVLYAVLMAGVGALGTTISSSCCSPSRRRCG